jgi:SAM-dependent methyltransferase
MFQILIFIIVVILGVLKALFSTGDCEVSGGGSKFQALDPKDFVQALATGKALDQDGNLITEKNFEYLDGHRPQWFTVDGQRQKWIPYSNIFGAPPEALTGETTFLMTPFLRQWQLDNIKLEHKPGGYRLFDIGIGTGRSLPLWKSLDAYAVSGVEPNLSNIEQLKAKNLPILERVEALGGESPEVMKLWRGEKYDVVLMSYSLTFFRDKTLEQLYKNIEALTQKGSYFIAIGMDGDIVRKFTNQKELDTPVFNIKFRKSDEIELTMKNRFTLVKAQREYLVNFKKFLKPFEKEWTVVKNEPLKAPFYIRGWAKRFVEAQRLVICRRGD